MPVQQGIPMSNGYSVPSGSPPMPYMGPVPYPNFYGQYSPPSGPKPGEGAYYPPIYIPVTPHPSQSHGGQEGGDQGYTSSHPHFYPTTFLTPYAQPYPSYMMHRDGQISIPGPHYAAYTPMYHKPPSAGSSSDLGGLRDSSGGEDRSVEKSS